MIKTSRHWDIVLLVEILVMVFLTGFFPESWLPVIYQVMYLVLYLTAYLCIDQNKKAMLLIGLLVFVIGVVSNFWNRPFLEAITNGLNFVFFGLIVVELTRELVQARTVTSRVILSAVNGYLLFGVVFAFLISLMIQFDPQAYNFSEAARANDIIYYAFITYSTTGYGDLLPLKPYSKSLAILIAVCGQLYVAIILALLVGKFSSQSATD